MTPRVVHCRREPYDVYIGRPSKWGNPHRVGTLPRSQAIAAYRAWLMRRPDLIADAKIELRGKVLGCWCAPQPCHGDVLVEVANDE